MIVVFILCQIVKKRPDSSIYHQGV